jgi:hypothetical protein
MSAIRPGEWELDRELAHNLDATARVPIRYGLRSARTSGLTASRVPHSSHSQFPEHVGPDGGWLFGIRAGPGGIVSFPLFDQLPLAPMIAHSGILVR